MSDRIFSVGWLAVCLVIAVSMWQMEVPFSYEPVGPKAFPLLLAALMTLCCIVLIVRPDAGSISVDSPLLAKGAMLITVLLAYATLFSVLGFPLSTALMVMSVSRIFGGSWATSTVTAASIAVGSFLLFDRLLEVSLPLGGLFG